MAALNKNALSLPLLWTGLHSQSSQNVTFNQEYVLLPRAKGGWGRQMKQVSNTPESQGFSTAIRENDNVHKNKS